jgi:cell division protein FtsB
MSYFKKTNVFKQVFFSKGTIIVLLFLIVFTGFGLFSVISKSMNASRERKVAENEIIKLRTKEIDLSKKIDMLKTPEGQNQILKEQYPVVESGEHVVVITENTSSFNSSSGNLKMIKKKSFWDYLKNLFKK